MLDITYAVSPSGVRIADDFLDNLFIDRYDPVFELIANAELLDRRYIVGR